MGDKLCSERARILLANVTVEVLLQPSLMCAGHGLCNFDSGKCTCHKGYQGVDCSGCADGFQKTGHGFCQPKPDFDTCEGDLEQTPKPSPPSTPPNDDGPKIAFGVKYEPWSECTKTCGGGTQTRGWGCFDGSGIYPAGMHF